jgi:hypothetical protein
MFHQKLSPVDGDTILKLRFTICRPDREYTRVSGSFAEIC